MFNILRLFQQRLLQPILLDVLDLSSGGTPIRRLSRRRSSFYLVRSGLFVFFKSLDVVPADWLAPCPDDYSTRVIKDIEEGYLPEWENLPAPEIAISYWYVLYPP